MALAYNLPGALHTDSFTVGDYTYTGSSIYIDDGNGKWRIKFLSNGTFTVAASKYATTDNSSFANSGGSSCVVGRSTSSTPMGTAMKFNAPSGGWGSYSRAVLHVYRTGGSASATVIVGHLNQAYSATIYCDKFYHNNYTSQIGSVSVGAASTWFSLDITSYKPSGSGEWGITLTSKNAYATVDGTNAYITLS